MQVQLLAPEILTAATGLLSLILGLVLPDRGRRTVGLLATAGLMFVLILVMLRFNEQAVLFQGIYTVDRFGNFFKVLFLTAVLLVFFMAAKYSEYFSQRRSEWYSFMIFATLGMMVMACSTDLITMYIGLEMMTISFYILSAYLLEDSLSAEAGLKYLILGAVSSAVLLFGMSLIYASGRSTVLADIYHSVLAALATQPVLVAGVILLIAGFGFKIAAVPFHMWVPDIYQGAPTPVAAFLAVGSKAAAFAALLRVLMLALPLNEFNWAPVVAVLSAITIVVGNLIALSQTNVKRLLAYSSIAQAGYIMVGLAAANAYGLKGVMYYAMLYVFSNVGAFAVTTAVEVQTGSVEMEAFSGLSRRNAALAAIMTICLLSLAGIPPLAGFVGKFYLFCGAMQAGYLWLAFIGLIMSMISVYYYLNLVRVMFIGTCHTQERFLVGIPAQIALGVCLIGTILLGVYPGPLSSLLTVVLQSLGADL